MTNEWSPETVFDVFADQTARTIITTARTEARTVTELEERCECSRSAVYRRITVMTQMGLLEERNRITQNGVHCNVYSTQCSELTVEITDERISLGGLESASDQSAHSLRAHQGSLD